MRPLQLAHFKLYLENAIELEAHRHGVFNGSTSPSLQWPRGATERLCGPLFGSVRIAVPRGSISKLVRNSRTLGFASLSWTHIASIAVCRPSSRGRTSAARMTARRPRSVASSVATLPTRSLMMSWERARWLAWQGYGEVIILVLLCRRRSSCAGGGAVTLLRRRRSRYAGGGVVTHRSRAIEVLTHRVGVSIYLVNT